MLLEFPQDIFLQQMKLSNHSILQVDIFRPCLSLGLTLCPIHKNYSRRQRELEQNVPTPEELFSQTVNGDYTAFAHSLDFLVQTTHHLQTLL